MNLKMIKRVILPVILILLTANLSAEFAPWNSDVLTGDSLFMGQKHNHNSKAGVYNGAQGGAYFLLGFFQVVLSPQDGPNCRHDPVCSSYGKQAVVMHGAFLGSILAGERLLRCNPYYPPLKDPVPEKPFGK